MLEQYLIIQVQHVPSENSENQHNLKNIIIISGSKNLNQEEDGIETIVIKMAKKRNIDVKQNEIIESKTMGKKEDPKIKVTFDNNEIKKIMEGKKTQISTKDIGLIEESILNINHELTLENQKLYKLARDFRRQTIINKHAQMGKNISYKNKQ